MFMEILVCLNQLKELKIRINGKNKAEKLRPSIRKH